MVVGDMNGSVGVRIVAFFICAYCIYFLAENWIYVAIILAIYAIEAHLV